MPLFGAHLSIAGGLTKAIDAALALGAQTVQIFTATPSQWNVFATGQSGEQSPLDAYSGKPILANDVAAFQQLARKSGLQFLTAHDSYLINLASPDDAVYEKSIAAFTYELDRAEALGLAYLVTHPGAHVGSGETAGLRRVTTAIDRVHALRPSQNVKVLLETTAGQGTCLGANFDHFANLLNTVKAPERLGICVDTCHIFAAGYPLGSEDEYGSTFEEFDRTIGLKQIRLFHINDSVKGLGSRVDRHAGIGLGMIGEAPFRRLVTDPRFRELPMILETPKEDDAGSQMDPINLGKLRAFLAEGPLVMNR